MKKIVNLIVVLGAFVVLNQAWAMPVDMHGYLRSGTGNNLQGGKQNCFNNPGSEGNEFRLGNECGIYGESTFLFEFIEKNKTGLVEPQFQPKIPPQNQDPSSFKVQTTLAFFPAANTQYGDEPSNNDVDIVEAYAQASHLENVPYTFWVGKRFYRDVDIHMNDFYYFAAMSGVGAGVKDIPMFKGNFAVAYLQETMTSTTSTDQLSKSFLDFRLFDVPVSFGQLNFWGTLARAPKGSIGTTNYEAVDGELLGVRLRNSLKDGFNDVALIYGRNLMWAMSVYGNGEIRTGVENNKRYKARFVEHLTTRAGDKWEWHGAAVFQHSFDGDIQKNWWDLGARAVYFINNNLHFVTEAGHSEVLSHVENLTLSRLTFAYELAITQSIWARPVLRVFVTETVWNKENRKNFNNKKEGHAIGFQTEAWF